MTEVVIFLGIALFLLLVLLIWAWNSPNEAHPTREFANLHEALLTFQLELPPPALMQRIFSFEDRCFVANHAPLALQHRFLDERKRIAHRWLRETKEKVENLMELHRMAARYSGRLHLATELRVAGQYASFLIVYFVLKALIWFKGPFPAETTVQYSRDLAEELYSSTGRLLLALDPAAFAKVRAEWKPS